MSTDSVRARLDAATPGPWNAHPWGGNIRGWAQLYEVGSYERMVVMAGDNDYGPAGGIDRPEDAELIAHAPTDLRLALEVIEAGKALLKALDEDHEVWIAETSLRATITAFERAP